jgi:hypothetical protein
MKISKKQIAKWQKQEQNRSAGRVANNEEMEQAWMKLKTKLETPELKAVLERMKNR